MGFLVALVLGPHFEWGGEESCTEQSLHPSSPPYPRQIGNRNLLPSPLGLMTFTPDFQHGLSFYSPISTFGSVRLGLENVGGTQRAGVQFSA